MELYFQEKLSLNGKVVITDAEENPIYTGKKGMFGKGKLFLLNKDGKKVITIIEKNGMFNKGFTIKKGNKKIAKLKKKFSIGNQKFSIAKLGWDITGNFLSKEYKITKGETAIAEIKKTKLVSLLEAYSIDVHEEDMVEEVLGTVLVLNKILGDKKKKLIKK